MNAELAGRLLWQLRRAWHGANYCRDRLQQIEDDSPRIDIGDGREIIDGRGQMLHEVDYYSWEAVRIINLGKKVIAAGMRGHQAITAAQEKLEAEAPHLVAFRHAITHPEDNRGADDVAYAGAAVRWQPGGRVQYLVDPRYEVHEALGALVAAIETALLTLAPPDDDPLPRYSPNR